MSIVKKRTVLVVDDSPVVLGVTAAVLATTGLEIITHTEAFGLFGAVIQNRPRLMVLDLEMPLMAGDEAVRILRGILGSEMPPVLLHSSAPLAELARRAEGCRVPDYIPKGDLSALLTRACKLLDGASR